MRPRWNTDRQFGHRFVFHEKFRFKFATDIAMLIMFSPPPADAGWRCVIMRCMVCKLIRNHTIRLLGCVKIWQNHDLFAPVTKNHRRINKVSSSSHPAFSVTNYTWMCYSNRKISKRFGTHISNSKMFEWQIKNSWQHCHSWWRLDKNAAICD